MADQTEPMRLVVVGAAGRMGKSLIRAVSEMPGVVLHAAIEREGSPFLGQDSGVVAGLMPNGIPVTADALTAFVSAQGVLDFTAPAATVEFAALAAQARLVHVIGTTGLAEPDMAKLKAAARHSIVVQSGNFSLGVNMLAALVKQAAKSLQIDWDIEIVEMHHRMKVDAPSGTALLLGEAAAQGRGVSLSNAAVKSREGHTGARAEGAIGFQALRGGSVVGDHTVIFAGNGERIELRHIAEDRGLFAQGAVKAALWGWKHGRSGYYTMSDVLGVGA
ncbi:MAG: 4-hydroxy-tetrahydrodipicolinate reductase [Rhizobiales bacterium]|nr:4-hydroxy-tetrahydrodipicolinate reductase [Hyphomicrobiales bacterium]